MAEKKVRRLVHDSDRKKVSKKTIIISSVVASLLAIAGIVIGVLFGLGVFEKKVETYTYFTEYANNKINTAEVQNILDEKEHVFLFIYNNEELDAKEGENDKEFDEKDNEIVKQLEDLFKVIDEKNASIPNNANGDNNLYFLYLVDTSTEGNEKIYEDSSLGGIKADADPAITYFYRGSNTTVVPEELDNKLVHGANDYTITSDGTNKNALIACLKDIKNFIRDLEN